MCRPSRLACTSRGRKPRRFAAQVPVFKPPGDPLMRTVLGRLLQIAFIIALAMSLHSLRTLTAEEEEHEVIQPPLKVDTHNHVYQAAPIKASATAVVNFGDLVRQGMARPSLNRPVRPSPWAPNEFE